MITKLRWVSGSALLFAAAAAAAPQAGNAVQQEGDKPQAEALAEKCSARKFETTVELPAAGTPRRSKITLCGEPDQTDAEWEATLRDAIEKIRANEKLPVAAKDRIVAEMNAEIANLGQSKAVPGLAPEPQPEAPTQQGAMDRMAPPVAKAAPVSARTPATPRLTIRCDTPGERGEDSCTLVQRNTAFAVTADEDMPAGTALRFLRRGSLRAELALAAMRRGETVRLRLPHRVCDGILNSRVEIQIVRRGAAGADSRGVTESLGPYPLSC